MRKAAISIAISAVLISPYTLASELIYRPVNPSFGGNPINGNYLLSNAQAQNKITGGDSRRNPQKSRLQRFNDSLQFRLLNQLLADIGDNGNNSGLLNTEDFIVRIEQGTEGLEVVTTDKESGEVTTIIVNGLRAD